MRKLRKNRVALVAGFVGMLTFGFGTNVVLETHNEKVANENTLQLMKQMLPETKVDKENFPESHKAEGAFYYKENDKIYIFVAGELYQVDHIENLTEPKRIQDVHSLLNMYIEE